MPVRLATLVGSAVLGGSLLMATAGPAAAAVCDAYSGTCTTPPAVVVLPTTAERVPNDTTTVDRPVSTTADRGATLPFTGGELVLLTALGAGALAGGTALVVAGRRRSPVTEA